MYRHNEEIKDWWLLVLSIVLAIIMIAGSMANSQPNFPDGFPSTRTIPNFATMTIDPVDAYYGSSFSWPVDTEKTKDFNDLVVVEHFYPFASLNTVYVWEGSGLPDTIESATTWTNIFPQYKTDDVLPEVWKRNSDNQWTVHYEFGLYFELDPANTDDLMEIFVDFAVAETKNDLWVNNLHASYEDNYNAYNVDSATGSIIDTTFALDIRFTQSEPSGWDFIDHWAQARVYMKSHDYGGGSDNDGYVLNYLPAVIFRNEVVPITPTLTNTNTPTATPTNTPGSSPTPTRTPSNTPTQTNTPASTNTPTNTHTFTPTYTEAPTKTPRDTDTPTQTPTGTLPPTNTPTQTFTASPTPLSLSVFTVECDEFASEDYGSSWAVSWTIKDSTGGIYADTGLDYFVTKVLIDGQLSETKTITLTDFLAAGGVQESTGYQFSAHQILVEGYGSGYYVTDIASTECRTELMPWDEPGDEIKIKFEALEQPVHMKGLILHEQPGLPDWKDTDYNDNTITVPVGGLSVFDNRLWFLKDSGTWVPLLDTDSSSAEYINQIITNNNQYITQVIGNDTTSISTYHGKNTKAVMVSVNDRVSNVKIYPHIELTDSNTVTITEGSAIANNKYNRTIIGAATSVVYGNGFTRRYQFNVGNQIPIIQNYVNDVETFPAAVLHGSTMELISANPVPQQAGRINWLSGEYYAILGNGSDTIFDVTHEWGSSEGIFFDMWDRNTGAHVIPYATHPTSDTIRFLFSSPPSSNQYDVVLYRTKQILVSGQKVPTPQTINLDVQGHASLSVDGATNWTVTVFTPVPTQTPKPIYNTITVFDGATNTGSIEADTVSEDIWFRFYPDTAWSLSVTDNQAPGLDLIDITLNTPTPLPATPTPVSATDQGALMDADFTVNGILIRTAQNTYGVTANNTSNWDNAYSERGSVIGGTNLDWDGSELDVETNLSNYVNDAGFLTSESQTLSDVMNNGNVASASLDMNNHEIGNTTQVISSVNGTSITLLSDIFLTPTSGGKIIPATMIEFDPDTIGDKVRYYSGSYATFIEAFTLGQRSDQDFVWESDTVDDMMTLQEPGILTVAAGIDLATGSLTTITDVTSANQDMNISALGTMFLKANNVLEAYSLGDNYMRAGNVFEVSTNSDIVLNAGTGTYFDVLGTGIGVINTLGWNGNIVSPVAQINQATIDTGLWVTAPLTANEVIMNGSGIDMGGAIINKVDKLIAVDEVTDGTGYIQLHNYGIEFGASSWQANRYYINDVTTEGGTTGYGYIQLRIYDPSIGGQQTRYIHLNNTQ